MTPSSRSHLVDQIARTRRAEDRDPIENAYAALACLTHDQRSALQDRINSTFGERHWRVAFQQVLA